MIKKMIKKIDELIILLKIIRLLIIMSQIYFSIIDIFSVGFVSETEDDCLICRGKLKMPCCECQDNIDNHDIHFIKKEDTNCQYLKNQMHNHCYVTLNTIGEWK